MEAREALAQLIVHKVEEVEEGGRDLDFLSDHLEEHVAALEALVSESLPALVRVGERKEHERIISEAHRAQLSVQLQDARQCQESEKLARNEEEAAAYAAASSSVAEASESTRSFRESRDSVGKGSSGSSSVMGWGSCVVPPPPRVAGGVSGGSAGGGCTGGGSDGQNSAVHTNSSFQPQPVLCAIPPLRA